MAETMHGLDAGVLDRLLGTVDGVMTRQVVTLEADTPADQAVRELVRRGVAGAPVLDRGRVVGLVTLRGMLRWAAPPWAVTGPFLRHEHELAAMRVRALMDDAIPVARRDWPVARAAAVMHQAGVTSLPVVDDGAVVGIVARDDVVRALAIAVAGERHPGHSPMPPD